MGFLCQLFRVLVPGELWSASFPATLAICSTPCTAVKLLHICYTELYLLFSVWTTRVCKLLHSSYLYSAGRESVSFSCLMLSSTQWLFVVRWHEKHEWFDKSSTALDPHPYKKTSSREGKTKTNVQYSHQHAHPTSDPRHHQGAAKSNPAGCCWHQLLIWLAGEVNRVGMRVAVTGVRHWKEEEEEKEMSKMWPKDSTAKTSKEQQRQAEYETERRLIKV